MEKVKPSPSWDISEDLSTEKIWISKLMALRSAAGHYVGRLCMDKSDYCTEPYSRESGYFKTEALATKAIADGLFES